ncbi:hypothetical protein DYB32_010025 [Aphanomyces invadans]|uniref:Uncharacterized protein n=1 Tax=Aphanomyces invadans TaxID=157072 RepID=A0A3R6V3C8_9STRA|nr:hypothetical protein DYB32_010025 [Aphanomyces invadans]
MFSPSTLVGGAQTLSLAIQGGGTATGEYTIQYVSTSTNETLYASQITVVPPPVAYAVHEPAWTGTTLASDTFDTLPFGAIPNATTSFWRQVDHGFASDACNALYFTHLGKRAAATTPFDLKGIDAQLSFAYIYGHRANPTYDAWGNNTLSCELVQAGAEVAVEMSIDNGTTWQPLVVLALPPTPTSTMQTTSLPLTSPSSVSMSGATAAGSVTSSFRWIQHTHTSTRDSSTLWRVGEAAKATAIGRRVCPSKVFRQPFKYIRREVNRDAAPASVGTAFVTLRPHERVVGVACCGTTYCNDSAPVVYGPVDASCARPTLATRCSTTAMRTIVATLTPGTSGGIVKYATSASDALTCSDAWPTYTAPLELSPATMAATTVVVKALTCVDGLKASDSLVTTVAVDMCCAGALTFPSSLPDQPCSHVLLFRDDFAACNITKWTKHTTQYGGDNINGGVHSDNVQCLANSADFSGASALALIVNGDRYPGTAPVGVRVQSDGSVATFQLKSCSAFGVATEVWALDILGIQSAVAAPSTLPFADLWRAALEQARTSPILHFSHGSAITDNRVHTFVLQWNRIEGRANVYRDGQLIRKLRSLPSSPDATPLTFHAYVPNAWAGEPRFTSCSTQIANVQVVNVETAANRWCDWEDEAPVSCTSDAACTQWMAGACLMPVASAVCVNKACAFALHPQFASPAVQAATAYRST